MATVKGWSGDEGVSFGPELVAQAARERFAPTVMTGVIVALSLVSLLALGAEAGLELAYPAAIVFIDGLVTSTFVYIFVVPGLYLLFAPRPRALTAPDRATRSGGADTRKVF